MLSSVPLMRSGLPRGVAVVVLCVLSACSHQSQTPIGTQNVAEAALGAGYSQMALTVSNNILAKEPRNVPALAARGDALYALGRKEDAAASYRKALALQPQDAGANAGLGRILVKTDPHAAERLLRASLATRPDNPVVLANLGVALDLEERHVEAQAQYRRALELAPSMTATKANLGLSLALSGDTSGAQAMLSPLAAAPDATASVRDNLAVARMLGAAPVAPPPIRSPTGSPIPLAPAPLAPAPVTPAPLTSGTPQSAIPAAPQPAGMFVQLAASNTQADADALWQRVHLHNAALLGAYQPDIAQTEINGRTIWRLRVRTASSADAQHLCDQLRSRGVTCWAGQTRGS